jgi:hypothetical protein
MNCTCYAGRHACLTLVVPTGSSMDAQQLWQQLEQLGLQWLAGLLVGLDR